MGVFKAYDVRGVVPDEVDVDLARRIGWAFARHLAEVQGEPVRVAVGRDVRASGEALVPAVVAGLRAGRASEVLDVGLVTTPRVYFAVHHADLSGGVMVTASHNPPEYNGFKLCRADARPVGSASGLRRVEELAAEAPGGPAEPEEPAAPLHLDAAYAEHVREVALGDEPLGPLRCVVDAGNGAAGTVLRRVLERIDVDPLEVIPLHFEPDGTFPNHPPDPLREANLADLVAAVRREGADLGIAFDGDGDRAAVVDERGAPVRADVVACPLARDFLAGETDGVVVHDLRSTRALPETVREAGGSPVEERVGHVFVKETMRERDAVFGAELSGHHYFRANAYADDGVLAALAICGLASRDDRAFSELVEPYDRYASTGERNYRAEDPAAVLEAVATAFPGAEIGRVDGVTVRTDAWWFNLRPSNTEPLIRLNLEADDPSTREEALRRAEGALEDAGARPVDE